MQVYIAEQQTPPGVIHGVVTFYSFSTPNHATAMSSNCMGTACYVGGMLVVKQNKRWELNWETPRQMAPSPSRGLPLRWRLQQAPSWLLMMKRRDASTQQSTADRSQTPELAEHTVREITLHLDIAKTA
jgi:hypothetical protein